MKRGLALGVVLALLLATPVSAAQQSCTISPNPVATGTSYTVSATGFRHNSTSGIMDYYGTSDTLVTTDETGSASATFVLPANAPTGQRMIMSEVYQLPYNQHQAAACWADVI